MRFNLNLFYFFSQKTTNEDKKDCHVEVAHFPDRRKVRRSRSVDVTVQSSTQTDASSINDVYVEDADIAAIDCDLEGKHLKDRRRVLLINEYLEIAGAGITKIKVSA